MTEDQKRKTSENMFNSPITDQNLPQNAIRRVVVNKKKKQSSTPGPGGVIEEDVEGEEYEEQEEEAEPDSIQLKGHKMALERVEAEQSSGDSDQEPARKVELNVKKEDEKKSEKDSKKDKKDKKEKEKKEKDKKKKETELVGYNKEDIDKGKKLMANASFKSNLDRLRNQFKNAGKSGIHDDNAQPAPTKPTLVPPTKPIKAPEPIKEGVEDVQEYGGQSDVIIREGGKIDDSVKTQIQTGNTRGLKDLRKPITPNIKFDASSKLKPAEKKQEDTQSTNLNNTNESSKEVENSNEIKHDRPKMKLNKPTASEEEPHTKKDAVQPKDLSYSEDWNIESQSNGHQKPRTAAANLYQGKPEPVENQVPELAFKKKKKLYGNDSDNSWDENEDRNPFD